MKVRVLREGRRIGGLARTFLIVAMVATLLAIVPKAEAAAVPGVVDFVLAASDAPEDGGSHTVAVALTVGPGNELDADFTVDIEVAGTGSANDPDDYTYLTTHTVGFSAGDTDGTPPETIALEIVSDAIDEDPEDIDLYLTNVANTTGTSDVGTTQTTHEVTITDDDTATLSVSDESVGEGGTMTFDVTLSTPSASSVGVSYSTADVQATAGSDYNTIPLTPVTFLPGQTLKTVDVTTLQDFFDEGIEETFTLDLSLATGAQISDGSGVGTITDNDSAGIVVSKTSVAVAEGGTPDSYTVALSSEPTAAVTVDLSGGPDLSFSALAQFDSGNWLGGQAVTVTAVNDAIVEGPESAPITHAATSADPRYNIAGPSVTANITDNNFGVAFELASSTATEGDTGATPAIVNLVVDTNGLAAATGPAVPAGATVEVVRTGGTAGGTDFTFTPPTPVSIGGLADGAAVPVTVSVTGDTAKELSETVILGFGTVSAGGLISPSDNAHTLTILDNDGPPGFSVLDATPVTEGPGSVKLAFTVALVPAASGALTVDYSTANGTAVAPADYTAIAPTTLMFDPGDTLKVVEITIANDAIDEIDETVFLNLTNSLVAEIADPQAVGTIKDDDNQAPVIDKFLITDASGTPRTTFALGETTMVNVEFSDPGLMDTHEVRVSWEDATPDFYQVIPGAGVATRTVAATHAYQIAAPHTITVIITDEEGAFVRQDAIPIIVEGSSTLDTVGLVDPNKGLWRLRNAVGTVKTLYYGNPGDYPFVGDWDCNGTETPGLYRQADGFVYLRNSNTAGIADIRFYFGNPGDIPLAGDFNGNGCDTVSIYRPSEGRVYIINALGANNGGLGAAELSYYFGNPGDKPFVGDFNRNGVETIGLHRESTGLVYFRNSHTQGIADNQFYFGNPADRLVAGDWTRDGIDTPALFRPSNTTMYFRHSNTQGNADDQFVWGESTWLPVAGYFGL